jgi:dynamin 1-like protein
MDKGTDATDVLQGRAVKLDLGWCAVVNRSQFDINANVDMHVARANEMKFFEANAGKYDCTVNCGTGTLTKMLVSIFLFRMGNSYDVVLCSQTRILGDSIRRQIPGIRDTIDASAAALDAELRVLGTSVPSDRGALMHEVLISCGRFEKDFGKVLDGGRGGKFFFTFLMGNCWTDSRVLFTGGETVRVIFEEKLVNSLRSLNLREFYSAKYVKSVIDATDGYQPHLVAPEMGIRRLIELGLARLREPAAQCVR